MTDLLEPITGDTNIKFQQIFDSHDVKTRQTKIICTIGGDNADQHVMVKMIDQGMNIARFDFTTGSIAQHIKNYDTLKSALKTRPAAEVALLVDLKGSGIKTGYNKDSAPIEMKKGYKFKVLQDPLIEGDLTVIGVNQPLPVEVDQILYIGDGELECEVLSIEDDFVELRCLNDHILKENQNVHVPGVFNEDVPLISKEDEEVINDFALKYNVDFISIPGIREVEDVHKLRQALGDAGSDIMVLSRIENKAALRNFEQVLAYSDGIIIARKQLSLEMEPEKLFVAQKWMIWNANLSAKTAVVGSQLLESMISGSRPARAEISDISNAVIEGADCLMLSQETTTNETPDKVIQQVVKCCLEAEKIVDLHKMYEDIKINSQVTYGTAESAAQAAVAASFELGISLIIAQTDNGCLGRYVAKYKPTASVLACSFRTPIIKQMQALRGVHTYKILNVMEGKEDLVDHLVAEAKKKKICKTGQKVIVIHGVNEDAVSDEQSIVRVLEIE